MELFCIVLHTQFGSMVNEPCKPSVALRHTYVVLRMRSEQSRTATSYLGVLRMLRVH